MTRLFACSKARALALFRIEGKVRFRCPAARCNKSRNQGTVTRIGLVGVLATPAVSTLSIM